MTPAAFLVYAVLVAALTVTLAVLVADAIAERRSLHAERLQAARVPVRRHAHHGSDARHPA